MQKTTKKEEFPGQKEFDPFLLFNGVINDGIYKLKMSRKIIFKEKKVILSLPNSEPIIFDPRRCEWVSMNSS